MAYLTWTTLLVASVGLAAGTFAGPSAQRRPSLAQTADVQRKARPMSHDPPRRVGVGYGNFSYDGVRAAEYLPGQMHRMPNSDPERNRYAGRLELPESPDRSGSENSPSSIPSNAENGVLPQSTMRQDVVTSVLKHVASSGKDVLWMECGSVAGDSAISTLKVARASGRKLSYIAADPVTGSLNKWAYVNGLPDPSKSDFLKLPHDNSVNHTYENLMSEHHTNGFDAELMRFRAKGIAGLRLMQSLQRRKQLEALPNVIYLESARMKYAMVMELPAAFEALRAGGVLFGNDFNSNAVRESVIAFAGAKRFPRLSDGDVSNFGQGADQPVNGVVVVRGQWVIPKAA